MLDGRSPLNREYLADLIEAVRDAAPQVIALDVALTRPKTGDPFGDETLKLYKAIASVPLTTTVVLTYRVAGGPDRYTREVGLLDGMTKDNVVFGCVTLTRDKTRLGLTIPLDDGQGHDTFATAIARAVDPEAVRARERKAREGSLVTTFLDPKAVAVVRAADVRERKPKAFADLAHKIVIIGGNWHDSATGKRVDVHDTPFGRDWSGAILIANYVEAILAPNATKRPMSGRFNVVMEILATIAVSLIFVVVLRPLLRVITLLLVALLVALASVVIFQNFGGFFDCSVVLFFLGAHSVLERSGSGHSNARRRFGLAFAIVISVVAAYLLYQQAKEPMPEFDTEDNAQVAKLTIDPAARDLDILPPAIAPDVHMATNNEAPKVAPTPVPAPAPAPAPQEPRGMRLKKTTGDIELAHLDAPQSEVAPAPTLPPTMAVATVTEPGNAEAMFRKYFARTDQMNMEMTKYTSEVVTLDGNWSAIPMSSSAPSMRAATGAWNTAAASQAFDQAWRESASQTGGLHMSGVFADSPQTFPSDWRPATRATGGDFEMMALRLAASARVLRPVRTDFNVTMLVSQNMFASDGTMSKQALDALARIAVEMMHDKELTIAVRVDLRDPDTVRSSLVVYEMLRQMRVEQRRVTYKTDSAIPPGEVRLDLSL
jgi:CHASE2 domain-containing sensor protein